MFAAQSAHVVNSLINCLPKIELLKIVRLCETVDLVFGTVLCEPDQTLEYVYFPLCGFIALVETIGGHVPLEVSLIGNEGMLGATIALGVKTSPLRGVVQGSGTALRMPAIQFLHELHESPALQNILNRYLYVLMKQFSQASVCICFHNLPTRLARWLLMTHDRAHADHFHLTHESLAGMLGVRRSGISIAARELQNSGLISYSRGEIKILNRKSLEAISCECYGLLLEDYTQLFS